jgi:DNA-binding NarL/FixJ family response regulator
MSAATDIGPERARVLFVDDHRILLEALAVVVGSQYQSLQISSLGELDQAIARFHPHVVVMDISMPEGDGIGATRRLRQTHPDVQVVLLSMHKDPMQVHRGLEAGARAFVSKSAPAQELLTALERVMNGEMYTSGDIASPSGRPSPRLTDRQQEVLRLVARGLSAKEIATALNISVRTAEFHRGAIMQRLGLHSTA